MIFTVSIGLFIEPYPITPLMGSACRGIMSYFGGSQTAMIAVCFWSFEVDFLMRKNFGDFKWIL
jgi:hypothetical protein